MVDVLHTPALGGGWEEIWRSLEMIEFFDLETVITYPLRLDTATTVARVGLFLEQHRERLVHPWNLIVPECVLDQRWSDVA